MKLLVTILVGVVAFVNVQPAKAQVDTLSDTTCVLLDEQVHMYAFVERKPIFDLFTSGNSIEEFQEWIYSNMRIPEIYAEASIQGRVIVEFVINRNGKVCDVKVLRSLDLEMDREVVRVVKDSPLWQPAIHHNKFVSVRLTLPVNIKL